MRGRVTTLPDCKRTPRITPAYAGKSPCSGPDTSAQRDHPRVCGEEKVYASRMRRQSGSPPRMRGRELDWTDKKTVDGITPAYAGKSNAHENSYSVCGDHPRVCGEENIRPCFWHIVQGSPPRMRGRELQQVRLEYRPGITPAYAGKRPPPFGPYEYREDHPRVCGEEYWRL